MKQVTEDLILSSYVLCYSDLLNLRSFVDVKFEGTILSLKCVLRFNIHNKFDIFRIRKLLKFEKNFFNIKINKGFYCVVFDVPTKYRNIICTTLNSENRFTTHNMIARYNALQQKTLAARESSQGLFFYYNPCFIFDFVEVSPSL